MYWHKVREIDPSPGITIYGQQIFDESQEEANRGMTVSSINGAGITGYLYVGVKLDSLYTNHKH